MVTSATEEEGTVDRPSRGARVMAVVRRLRVASGIVLLLVLSLKDPYQYGLMLFKTSFSTELHDVAEQRYRRLNKTLPPKGVYGFRTVGPLKLGKNYELEGDGESIARYVLAQFLLAPRVIDLGRSPIMIIRDDVDPVRVWPREGL
jgi:hypothetical protein